MLQEEENHAEEHTDGNQQSVECVFHVRFAEIPNLGVSGEKSVRVAVSKGIRDPLFCFPVVCFPLVISTFINFIFPGSQGWSSQGPERP